MSTLLEKTIAELHETNRTDADIARHLGVSPRWVNLLRHGKIPNPGVNTVERLYNYLKKANEYERKLQSIT